MRIRHNAACIRLLVDAGHIVHAGNSLYYVNRYRDGQYLIADSASGYYIGLTGQKGTKYEKVLNSDKFFTHMHKIF